MPENSPAYFSAPVTNRRAGALARRHGFSGIKSLANSLPEDGWALDLGAGGSNLGEQIALIRPDVNVVNFDYSYHNPDILEAVSQNSPPNLSFVAGDATKLPEYFDTDKFHAVFSFMMFCHLSIRDIEPAIHTGNGIYDITRPGGLMSVGPRNNLKNPIQFIGCKTMVEDKPTDGPNTNYGQRVATRTQLSPLLRGMLLWNIEAQQAAYGDSNQFFKRVDGKRYFRNPNTGEFARSLSLDGLEAYMELAQRSKKYKKAHGGAMQRYKKGF